MALGIFINKVNDDIWNYKHINEIHFSRLSPRPSVSLPSLKTMTPFVHLMKKKIQKAEVFSRKRKL